MQQFELLKSETVPLTFELARDFKDMEASVVERPLSETRKSFLERKCKNGDLVNFNWVTCELDGKTYRINGNHSSNMLFLYEGGFPTGLFVHHDHYRVTDHEGMVHLFRQLDARQSGRSPSDVANAYQQISADLRDVNPAVAKLAAEGIAWWGKNVEGVFSWLGDERYAVLHDTKYHPFVKWCDTVLSIKTPEMINQTVVAAMFATFEADRERAEEFWLKVSRGGVEFEDANPTTVLDEWLKANKMEPTPKRRAKPGEIYQACAYAWNAYIRRANINRISISKSKKALHELIAAGAEEELRQDAA